MEQPSQKSIVLQPPLHARLQKDGARDAHLSHTVSCTSSGQVPSEGCLYPESLMSVEGQDLQLTTKALARPVATNRTLQRESTRVRHIPQVLTLQRQPIFRFFDSSRTIKF
jgi:hypothetical protein